MSIVVSYLNPVADAGFCFKVHGMESAYLQLITVQIYPVSCLKDFSVIKVLLIVCVGIGGRKWERY